MLENTDRQSLMNRKTRTHNSIFAIGGVSRFADNSVVNGSAVLQINNGLKKPVHCKSAKR